MSYQKSFLWRSKASEGEDIEMSSNILDSARLRSMVPQHSEGADGRKACLHSPTNQLQQIAVVASTIENRNPENFVCVLSTAIRRQRSGAAWVQIKADGTLTDLYYGLGI